VEHEVIRARIWDLFLGSGDQPGKNQFEIAEIIGCTQQNVSKYIRSSLERFVHNNSTKCEQYLARELKLCFYREAKAVERYRWAEKAWRKSIGLVQIKTKSSKPIQKSDADGHLLFSEDGAPIIAGTITEESVKEEYVVGDPKLLRAMEEADAAICRWHERRCKMLGLEAARKIDLGFSKSDPANLPDSELEQAVMRMADSLRGGFMVPSKGNGNGNGNGNGKPH
jgi:hypothetical protein